MQRFFILVFLMACFIMASAHNNQIAMPNLDMAIDARAAAMGDIGVSTSPDPYAAFWNPAKLSMLGNSFISSERNDVGVSLGYTPFASFYTKDMYILYFNCFKKINDYIGLGLGLNYFKEGNNKLNDEIGTSMGVYDPDDFSIDATYSQSFGFFSLGLNMHYIHSDEFDPSAVKMHRTSNSLAADGGFYYEQQLVNGDHLRLGAALSNVGAKVGYGGSKALFLPMNLGLGINYGISTTLNAWNLGLEFNKSLVPNIHYMSGESDPSVPDAIIMSLSQFEDYSASIGAEYLIQESFALRSGFKFSDPHSRNDTYATFGIGYENPGFRLDLSYLSILRKLDKAPYKIKISMGIMF